MGDSAGPARLTLDLRSHQMAQQSDEYQWIPADSPLTPEDIHEIDVQARRILREWYRYAPIAGQLTYRGVPLGAATEFHSGTGILGAVIKARVERLRRGGAR